MQSLQWADYHLFESNEGALLFEVDHASLFALEPEAVEILRKWSNKEEVILDKVPESDRSLLEGLRDVRVLRPGHWRQPSPSVLDFRDAPMRTLVLEVAQACNLRCAYCYAEGGTYGHEEPRMLNHESARKAVRYLLDKSGDLDQVTIIFFGGEPLLNMEAVQAATDEAHLLEEKTGKKVHLSLTTNGTLLDADTVSFLHRNRVSVAISLDGPEDLHNRNRPDLNGRGTYEQILSRLRPLLENSPTPVAARVTLLPDQWARVAEVFDHLLELGVHEVGIAPASPITHELLPTEQQQADLLQGFRCLAERFVSEAQSGNLLPFSNILDLLGRLHVGQTKSISCGAGLGYLAVDANEQFFLCHRLAGEESFRLGSLDSGVDAQKVHACLHSLDNGRQEDCSNCWARTLCAGGCHYENHLRENMLGLPRGTGCDFIRGWLQVGVETYAKLRASGAIERLDSRLKMRASC